MTEPTVELDQHQVHHLLDSLDRRLRDRGVAASIYVVGGVAIALTVAPGRRTADLDALVSDAAVLEEAQALGADEGLPPHWLNQSVRRFVPPRPPEALALPTKPGLRVHVAPPEHLLAMKLVALRQRDVVDIIALVEHLGLQDGSADRFVDLLLEVYGGEEALATAIGGPADRVLAEVRSIGCWLEAELGRRRCGPPMT